MADKERTAQADLRTNFGQDGMLGSDGSREAADAWYSVLTGGEEHEEDNAVGETPDDDGQEADESEEELEAEEESEEEGNDEDDGEEDPDEDEEDDGEEEADEEDDKPAKELDPETKVKVKVNGEEVEVPLKELQAGYSRTQDYTRKTQEVAEERRLVEAERDKVLQQQQQWSGLLDQLRPQLEAQLSGRSEEEWSRLKAQDEIAYYEERDKERALQQRVEAIKAEQTRVHQELQARQKKQLQDYARQERELLMSKIPDWTTDESLAKREVQQMREYGTEIGFSEQELNGIIDHRALLILRDAAKFRALQKVKEKGKPKVTKRTKTLTPGTPSTESSKRTKARKAKQRLAKTKSVDAAVPYFEQLLGNE